MVRWQCFLFDRQRALVKRLSLLIVPLILTEEGQANEGNGDVGMVRRQYFFSNCQGALVERFRLLIAPL